MDDLRKHWFEDVTVNGFESEPEMVECDEQEREVELSSPWENNNDTSLRAETTCHIIVEMEMLATVEVEAMRRGTDVMKSRAQGFAIVQSKEYSQRCRSRTD